MKQEFYQTNEILKLIMRVSAVFSLLSNPHLNAQSPGPSFVDEEFIDEDSLGDYNFEDELYLEPYKVPGFYSTLTLHESNYIITGELAKKITMEIYGHDCDALIDCPLYPYPVNCKFLRCGYVSLESWDKLDIDAILKSYKENGGNTTVLGWIKKPKLDIAARTVSWSIECETDGIPNALTFALKFGRSGFAEFQVLELLPNATVSLDYILDHFKFDQFHQYEDHLEIDQSSGFNIAQLIHEKFQISSSSNDSISLNEPIPKPLIMLYQLIQGVLLTTFLFGCWKVSKMLRARRAHKKALRRLLNVD